jgi:hypothetical protein
VSACEALREALVETARGATDTAGVRRHAAACPACAALLVEQEALTRVLGLLAAQDAGLEVAPTTGERLRSNVRALDSGASATRRWSRPRTAFIGLAAAVLVAWAVAARLWPTPTPRPAVPEAARLEEPFEFAPLVYGQTLDDADALHLTRVRVSRSALVSLGWPAPTGQEEGPPVEADVLIGQDGLARGIRFVSDDGGVR